MTRAFDLGVTVRQPCLPDVNSSTVTELLCNSNYEWVNEYGTRLRKENRQRPDGRVCTSVFSFFSQRAHFFQLHAVFSITVKTAHWGRVVWVRALPCFSFPSVTCVIELLNPSSGILIWKWLIVSCLMEIFLRKFRGQRETWTFASIWVFDLLSLMPGWLYFSPLYELWTL